MFLLLGAVLVYVYSLLWIPGMPYFYYLVIYISIEIVAALVIIPWETLASEMTDDYKQRSILSATRLTKSFKEYLTASKEKSPILI